jgi:hypothetical protein
VCSRRFVASIAMSQENKLLDRQLWEHFGSEERVLETLRLLVSIAEKGTRPVA